MPDVYETIVVEEYETDLTSGAEGVGTVVKEFEPNVGELITVSVIPDGTTPETFVYLGASFGGPDRLKRAEAFLQQHQFNVLLVEKT